VTDGESCVDGSAIPGEPIPVAAGMLYPSMDILLSPVFARGVLAMSSIFVLGNSLQLSGFQPPARGETGGAAQLRRAKHHEYWASIQGIGRLSPI